MSALLSRTDFDPHACRIRAHQSVLTDEFWCGAVRRPAPRARDPRPARQSIDLRTVSSPRCELLASSHKFVLASDANFER